MRHEYPHPLGPEFIPMSSDVTVRGIRFVTALPWLRLGRAWGCALSPQQAGLCCLAALVWAVLVPLMRPNPPVNVVVEPQFAWTAPAFIWSDRYAGPLADILDPARACLVGGPGWWRDGVAAAAAFVMWSIVGLAVCRCAAVQFCRDENPVLRDAVQFALVRIANVCGAPLIPLLGAIALCALVAVLALPAWVLWLGTAWLYVLAPVFLALSGAAAFILLALPFLWPLMVAAVAIDDSDAFDAFSRAFSLVASRFWSTLGLLIVCLIEAAVAFAVLTAIAGLGISISVWSADWLVSETAVEILGDQVRWWAVVGVDGLMASLFWTLATVVYLFLREMVDAVPVSQIKGFEDAMPSRDPYPVVGIAATKP